MRILRVNKGFAMLKNRPILVGSAFALLCGAAAGFQSRKVTRPDSQAQIFQYYKQYPDRYIRVTKESWTYDQKTRAALHSFTLNNTAMVPYCEVQVRFTYQDGNGGTLATQPQQVPGILQPFRPMEFRAIKVKNVPDRAANALLAVSKALICR